MGAPAILLAAAAATQVGGAVMGGISARRNASIESDQMNRQANDQFATIQRKNYFQEQQNERALSDIQAQSSLADPTANSFYAKTAAQGEFNQESNIFAGKTGIQSAAYRGDVARFGAKQQTRAGFIGAASSILNTASSFAAKGPQPPAGSVDNSIGVSVNENKDLFHPIDFDPNMAFREFKG